MHFGQLLMISHLLFTRNSWQCKCICVCLLVSTFTALLLPPTNRPVSQLASQLLMRIPFHLIRFYWFLMFLLTSISMLGWDVYIAVVCVYICVCSSWRLTKYTSNLMTFHCFCGFLSLFNGFIVMVDGHIELHKCVCVCVWINSNLCQYFVKNCLFDLQNTKKKIKQHSSTNGHCEKCKQKCFQKNPKSKI